MRIRLSAFTAFAAFRADGSIMGWLDIPTALFILGLLYLMAPGMTWAVLGQDRTPSAAWWCLGGLLFGAGVILASFASKLPALLGVLLSNVLFLSSCALRVQSLRQDLGRPASWLWMGSLVALQAVFTAVTHWGLGWYTLRASVNTAVVALGLTYVVHLAVCVGQQEKSRNAHMLASVYAAFVLALLVRVVEIIASPGGDPIPVARPVSTALIAMTGLVAAVAGHFCYLGLLLDRARRRERTLLAEQAHSEALNRLQQQMRQVERQRSIDEMSVSLAHELSQPVGAVLTNAQTGLRALQQERLTAELLSPLLQQIEHSARHASRVIERIRSFIQPSRHPRRPVDLREVCDSACELLAADLRARDILLVRAPTTDTVLVFADALELTQALLNGLRNATDALAKSQRREIHLSYGAEATWAWLRVEDSGPGMQADALHRATEPFYTTKTGGLGLGISIANSIAQRHGGGLVLGQGTPADLGGATFELRLPLTSSLPPAAP